MKKLIYSILAIGILVSSCKKNDDRAGNNGSLEPAQKQRVVMIEAAADWCSACPAGTLVYESTLLQVEDQAVPVVVHKNDDLMTPMNQFLLNELFGNSGIPNYFYNDGQVSDVNADALAIATRSPIAGVGHEWSKTGNTVKRKAKVKFFESASGTYYLGTFVQQGPVIAEGNLKQVDALGYLTTVDDVSVWAEDRNGNDANGNSVLMFEAMEPYEHRYTLVAGSSEEQTFGDVLSGTSFSSGDSFTIDFSYTIPEGTILNELKVVSILFKEDSSGNLTIENGYRS